MECLGMEPGKREPFGRCLFALPRLQPGVLVGFYVGLFFLGNISGSVADGSP